MTTPRQFASVIGLCFWLGGTPLTHTYYEVQTAEARDSVFDELNSSFFERIVDYVTQTQHYDPTNQ